MREIQLAELDSSRQTKIVALGDVISRVHQHAPVARIREPEVVLAVERNAGLQRWRGAVGQENSPLIHLSGGGVRGVLAQIGLANTQIRKQLVRRRGKGLPRSEEHTS